MYDDIFINANNVIEHRYTRILSKFIRIYYTYNIDVLLDIFNTVS